MAYIQGNSRCIIEFADDVVRKIAADQEYAPRLKKQIDKQRDFASRNTLWFCRTPAIISDRWNGGLYEAAMQYVAGADFIEYIKNASRDELALVCHHIVRVIEQNIEACSMATVPFSVLRDKVQSIDAACPSPVLAGFAGFEPEDLVMPVGPCHGDLTLSNILFGHSGITLIDFLDNFIETPLQDMAKVRQDTCYLWSCQLYRQPYDPIRTRLALTFMDATLDRLFRRHDFYVRHYRVFQFVNLARILPYCRSDDLRRHVEQSIQTLVRNHV